MSEITINGTTYSGERIDVIGGNVYIDGVSKDHITAGQTELVIKVVGDVASVKSDRSIRVTGNVMGAVKAGGSVQVGGYVGCGVEAEGSVQCGDVAEGVNAEGSVQCGKVRGSVTAGGSVRHG